MFPPLESHDNRRSLHILYLPIIGHRIDISHHPLYYIGGIVSEERADTSTLTFVLYISGFLPHNPSLSLSCQSNANQGFLRQLSIFHMMHLTICERCVGSASQPLHWEICSITRNFSLFFASLKTHLVQREVCRFQCTTALLTDKRMFFTIKMCL